MRTARSRRRPEGIPRKTAHVPEVRAAKLFDCGRRVGPGPLPTPIQRITDARERETLSVPGNAYQKLILLPKTNLGSSRKPADEPPCSLFEKERARVRRPAVSQR